MLLNALSGVRLGPVRVNHKAPPYADRILHSLNNVEHAWGRKVAISATCIKLADGGEGPAPSNEETTGSGDDNTPVTFRAGRHARNWALFIIIALKSPTDKKPPIMDVFLTWGYSITLYVVPRNSTEIAAPLDENHHFSGSSWG